MDVIKVKDVWKKYRIYHDKGSTLKERILFKNRNRYEDRWVLKGINLNIKKGETVGLIGENGSGKSTLLKLLTKIIYPDKGEIEIKGKVSSLLELGAGFHPDMTGKENIYTNASIFGLTKQEIDKKLDDIIAFSELEEFIDNPVRTYSSGMYMRLAFSVAINVDADILLIDEILAVGDVNFQKKCFNKLKELKKANKTIVIVSHDLSSLEKICDEVVWLCNGKIERKGRTKETLGKYMLYMDRKNAQKNNVNKKDEVSVDKSNTDEKGEQIKKDTNRWGNKNIEITEVKLLDSNKQEKHLFMTGESLTISMSYVMNKNVENPIIGVQIFSSELVNCFGTHTQIDKVDVKLNKKGVINFHIKQLQLVPGEYYLDVAITDEYGVPCDYHSKCYSFNVYSDINDIGIYRPIHYWEVI